jgi:hypothetical protein
VFESRKQNYPHNLLYLLLIVSADLLHPSITLDYNLLNLFLRSPMFFTSISCFFVETEMSMPTHLDTMPFQCITARLKEKLISERFQVAFRLADGSEGDIIC